MRAELAALELDRLTRKRAWRGVRRVAGEFQKFDLLTYSSAIAFQVLYAVVPLALLGLAGLGLLGLGSVYRDHIAHTLRRDLSPDAFRVVDRTAVKVIGAERYWWATLGVLVTVWGVGASIRAMMTALNRVYGARETRSFLRRFLVSLGVALVVITCVFGAIAVVLGGRLVHAGGVLTVALFLGRWVVTLALLLLAIAALIRFVPAKSRPVEWISVGSVVSTVSWIVTTVAFAGYVSVAPYSSYFGAFATIVLLLIYLHLRRSRSSRAWSSTVCCAKRSAKRAEADVGDVEAVHRLVGDAADAGRKEDARVQVRVRSERGVVSRDLDVEPAVGAIPRGAAQALRRVECPLELPVGEVRDVRVPCGADRPAVEELLDDPVGVAVVRPRDHVGDVEIRPLHRRERQLAEPRGRADLHVQADVLQVRGDDQRSVLAVERAAGDEDRLAAAQVAVREPARGREVRARRI